MVTNPGLEKRKVISPPPQFSQRGVVCECTYRNFSISRWEENPTVNFCKELKIPTATEILNDVLYFEMKYLKDLHIIFYHFLFLDFRQKALI